MLGCASLVFILFYSSPALASAGTNQQLSFTGKLVNTNGTAVTDGTYNVEFKIYQDGNSSGSGSTLEWTEDYLVAGSSGMPSTGGITTTGGVFQVNLGSICALSGGTCGAKTNTGVDFNQQTLWLSIQLGGTSSCTVTSGTTSFNTACSGDGEMTPYIRLTAVPQALNADKLDGIDSTGFILNQTGLQNTSNFHLSGSGSADTSFTSPLFDSQASSNALGIGTTNAGAISIGNATYTTGVTFAVQNVAAAYQFQNNNAEPIFLIDTQGKDNNGNTNLIKNPGFENGVSGWNGANTNCQTITKNTTLANTYNGIASADCLTAASGTTTVTVNQFNATLAAGSYNFSFYAKGGAAITLSATVTFTGGGANCTNLAPTSVTTTGFQRFSCSVTTSGTTTDLRFTTTTTGQHLYIDAAQLTSGGTGLLPYRIGNIQFRGVVNNPVVFQAVSNSVNAFQVEDASANSLLLVDTYNSQVVVDGVTANSGALSGVTTIDMSGQLSSTVSTGTAPFVVASTTQVNNLNVSQLQGGTWASPVAIGTGTPAAGTFTTVTVNTATGLTLGIASSANGGLVFKNATNANTISLTAAATNTSITVKLPATTPGTSVQTGASYLPFVTSLTADTATTNSTALSDIVASGNVNDTLSLTIPAGLTVNFKVTIMYVSSSTSNSGAFGWKCSNASQSSVGTGWMVSSTTTIATGGSTTACGTTAAALVTGVASTTSTSPALAELVGTIKANASSATTVTFEYARSGTGSTTTLVKAGSYVQWWQ